ncbi:MAG: nucleotide exchange factor GrpE [Candidatus Omnitrophica bacterium]|nr:nucleotide exchange factor GrpE [Candidatus Omnitrophota bacterium]
MTDENIEENEEVIAEPEQPQVVVDPVEKLTQELGEAKDKYIRLFAEFDNMRKRNERERAALIKYAHEEVIIEMLGFFEDFERTIAAAKAAPSDNANLLKGVEMVYGRMQQLLKKYDVREIDAMGKKFDHERHEALMVAESDECEDGTVLEVFQKGYMLGERVVRTAKVKVSKKN